MKSPEPVAPDLDAMARAVDAFLTALGHPPQETPLLRETPALVARAWADEFLDGYRRDPKSPLGDGIPIGDLHPGLVSLDAIHFVSVCPHHLLPYRGVARIAYAPRGRIVGFGAIVQCIDALAHRLVLQEVLAAEIARNLREGMGAAAVFVRLEAEQNCLALRGENRPGARAICEAVTPHDASFELLQELRGALR